MSVMWRERERERERERRLNSKFKVVIGIAGQYASTNRESSQKRVT